MSACCSFNKKSIKYSKRKVDADTSIELSGSEATERKQHKKKRVEVRRVESESQQDVDLVDSLEDTYDDSQLRGDQGIGNGKTDSEMEEISDEGSDSEEEIGDCSESEAERESEEEGESGDEMDADVPHGSMTNKRFLHRKLTRDIRMADMDVNDDSAQKIKELNIVIDWEPPPLHLAQTGLQYLTRKEEKSLAKEGIIVKRGMWTWEEEKTLAENWIKFSKEYDIRNPLALLGLKEETRTWKSEALNFTKYLGQGLSERPLLCIYQRARRLLDPRHFRGRFSKSERRTMKHLVAKYGHNWSKIGHCMDRSGPSLYTFYKSHDRDYNHGKWTIAEDKSLIKALAEVTGELDLTKVHHNLPWTEVSKVLKTRNGRQCNERWKHIVSWVACGKLPARVWKTEDNIKLIKMLRDSSFQNEADIPFLSMYKEFGYINCFQLKSRWANLRMRVPQYYIKPLPEIIDWLVENYLPIIELRVRDREEKRVRERNKRAEMKERESRKKDVEQNDKRTQTKEGERREKDGEQNDKRTETKEGKRRKKLEEQNGKRTEMNEGESDKRTEMNEGERSKKMENKIIKGQNRRREKRSKNT